MLAASCSDATQMLQAYLSALAEFHGSQKTLVSGMLHDHPGFRQARIRKERALTALVSARRIYWQHLTDHRCREGRTGCGLGNVRVASIDSLRTST